MKLSDNTKVTLIIIGVIVLAIGIYFGQGYLFAAYESTAGQAIENAKTEKFIHSKTYILGKVQAATKYYSEWRQARKEGDETEMRAIEQLVVMETTEIDIDEFEDPVRSWLFQCRTK